MEGVGYFGWVVEPDVAQIEAFVKDEEFAFEGVDGLIKGAGNEDGSAVAPKAHTDLGWLVLHL